MNVELNSNDLYIKDGLLALQEAVETTQEITLHLTPHTETSKKILTKLKNKKLDLKITVDKLDTIGKTMHKIQIMDDKNEWIERKEYRVINNNYAITEKYHIQEFIDRSQEWVDKTNRTKTIGESLDQLATKLRINKQHIRIEPLQ